MSDTDDGFDELLSTLRNAKTIKLTVPLGVTTQDGTEAERTLRWSHPTGAHHG